LVVGLKSAIHGAGHRSAAGGRPFGWLRGLRRGCARAQVSAMDRFVGLEPNLGYQPITWLAAGVPICRTACGDAVRLRMANPAERK